MTKTKGFHFVLLLTRAYLLSSALGLQFDVNEISCTSVYNPTPLYIATSYLLLGKYGTV